MGNKLGRNERELERIEEKIEIGGIENSAVLKIHTIRSL